MQRSDFAYDLPPELIAQAPPVRRTGSRLLALDGRSGERRDLRFDDLPSLLRPHDLLVLNDTRVIPARAYAVRETGGRVELLLERMLDTRRVLVQLRASKSPKPGQTLTLEGGVKAKVLERRDSMFVLELQGAAHEYFERHGHVPLPPYIARADQGSDRERYQTVFARTPGAVAAPTAGLHFDEDMLGRLHAIGVRTAYVTLHVGAGTFAPVRTEDIREHAMHSEYACLGQPVCEAVAATRARGGRVIAVGTTSVRTLEAAAAASEGATLAPFSGETRLFIYPGYRFRVVDAIVTNFHLSESTLLMLVSAFAGTERVLVAYRHAVAQRYRFFSYGDAMFVTPQAGVALSDDTAGPTE